MLTAAVQAQPALMHLFPTIMLLDRLTLTGTSNPPFLLVSLSSETLGTVLLMTGD